MRSSAVAILATALLAAPHSQCTVGKGAPSVRAAHASRRRQLERPRAEDARTESGPIRCLARGSGAGSEGGRLDRRRRLAVPTSLHQRRRRHPTGAGAVPALGGRAVPAAAREHGRDDPAAHCKPSGVPILNTTPVPLKIVQTPGLIVILYEENTVFRQIFLDGRKTVEDPVPRFMGYSTGKWDGDVLVVDTIGFNDQAPARRAGPSDDREAALDRALPPARRGTLGNRNDDRRSRRVHETVHLHDQVDADARGRPARVLLRREREGRSALPIAMWDHAPPLPALWREGA